MLSLILLLIILLIRLNLKNTGQTGNNNTNKVVIIVQLKYLSNFGRSIEMSLIYFENNLILAWSASCVTSCNAAANQTTKFATNDTEFYVPAVTLST